MPVLCVTIPLHQNPKLGGNALIRVSSDDGHTTVTSQVDLFDCHGELFRETMHSVQLTSPALTTIDLQSCNDMGYYALEVITRYALAAKEHQPPQNVTLLNPNPDLQILFRVVNLNNLCDISVGE